MASLDLIQQRVDRRRALFDRNRQNMPLSAVVKVVDRSSVNGRIQVTMPDGGKAFGDKLDNSALRDPLWFYNGAIGVPAKMSAKNS